MGKKDVNDYLQEGIYGVRRPKEAERDKYLGTLRERIVLVLTIGQVMSDSGIDALERAMKKHPNTKLLLNGQVSYRFLDKEKELARKYNIPYTIITNEEIETKVGAVLTYDYAVNIENIYVDEEKEEKEEVTIKKKEVKTLFTRVRRWFV